MALRIICMCGYVIQGGDVAAPRERFHEVAVPGLAVGRELGQHPGALLGLRQGRAAKAEAGGGEAL
ncbi:MAG TPA: hypothetical protein VF933_15350 [Streptosporangiaceae bacterium]